MNYIEIIGYIGSALVAISLMMKNIYYLRRINLIGAATFATYGLLVGAIPVFILNSFISLVDIYYIIEMKKKKEYFTLLPIEKSDSALLLKFYNFYKSDIYKFFPKFDIHQIDEDKSFFILRNLIPVGLFAYKEINKNEILIELDYAIPDYRDLKNARFVYFAQSQHFLKKGYKILKAETDVVVHKKYLLKIGFKNLSNNSNQFVKNI
ncbi:MAG: hypothetical protein KDC88_05195 [Ignavibacteriae bacterium]|nr:hypothetical protein [Ignavibacteriota bacterium]MCB9258747.1 hypothetical protein [Ignavibacteriales bacterium]